jgi:hypothetical protein
MLGRSYCDGRLRKLVIYVSYFEVIWRRERLIIFVVTRSYSVMSYHFYSVVVACYYCGQSSELIY